MKTERRHELQHNELADWLGDSIAKIQPYTKVILGIGILLAVGAFASTYLGGQNEQADEAAWAAYYQALDTGELTAFGDLANNFPGTPAAAWAELATGDVKLGTGLREMFTDRDKAKEELTAAKAAYEKALQMARGNEMLEQRARYGLAQSQESLGELDPAIAQLKEIVQRWPESTVGVSAKTRLDQLQRPETKDWYAWFAEQKPVKSPLSESTFMNDLPNLPDKPNLTVPQPGQLVPGADAGSPANPATGLGLPELGTAVQGGSGPREEGASESAAESDSGSDATESGPSSDEAGAASESNPEGSSDAIGSELPDLDSSLDAATDATSETESP